MHKKGFAIAIDGPVAAGKGTIAPRLAKKLNGFYLYTGAMYRSLALEALRRGINLDDEGLLSELVSSIDIKLSDNRVYLNSEDVTGELTREDVASGSSKVAVFKRVREQMVKKQRDIAEVYIDEGKIVIAEGRDTGTKVFPDARLKVFLTAYQKIRAKRRLNQLKEKNVATNLNDVLSEVKKRDERDTHRNIDPLISDPESFGYFVLDNSNLTEEETVNKIIERINKLND